jgi:hypothetical protein
LDTEARVLDLLAVEHLGQKASRGVHRHGIADTDEDAVAGRVLDGRCDAYYLTPAVE